MITKPQVKLQNFLKMSPDAPQYSDKTQHYYMSGVNPTYYLDTPGIQEEQIAPLIASVAWTKAPLAPAFNLSIDDIVPSNNNTYDAYAIGSDSETYGINAGSLTVTQFGFPSGSSQSSGNHRTAIFANNMIVSVDGIGGAGNAELYRMATPGGGGWTGITSLSGSLHHLETFSKWCMVSSGSKIDKLETSFSSTLTPGLDFGTGWSVLDMKNYNDQYLVSAVTQGNFDYTYLSLWDGIQNFSNAKVRVPGKFLGMKVINGVLNVAVLENGGSGTQIRTSIYYLKNTTLVLKMTPVVSPIIVPVTNQHCLFNFSNKLGILLLNTDCLTYGSRNNGLEEFVISTGIAFDHFSETSGGLLIGTAFNGTNTDLYVYIPTQTTYNPINYISEWIPVNNPTVIDIIYDSPPQSNTDAINVTVTGKGEDIITAETQIIPLQSITSTNKLNLRRTRLDLQGFTGSLLMINLTTVNNGSWRPIIRAINPI